VPGSGLAGSAPSWPAPGLPPRAGHRCACGRRAREDVADGLDVPVAAPDQVRDQRGSSRSGARRRSRRRCRRGSTFVKTRLSCQAGLTWSSRVPPKQGRRPSGPRVKIEMSRSCRSRAISSRVSRWPDPVGYSTVTSSPQNRWYRFQGAGSPGSSAGTRPARRQLEFPPNMAVVDSGGLVVDGGPDPLPVDLVRVLAVVGGQGPQPVRREELGLVEQAVSSRSSRAGPARLSSSRCSPGSPGASPARELPRVASPSQSRKPAKSCPGSAPAVEVRLVDDPGGQGRDDADHGAGLHRGPPSDGSTAGRRTGRPPRAQALGFPAASGWRRSAR